MSISQPAPPPQFQQQQHTQVQMTTSSSIASSVEHALTLQTMRLFQDAFDGTNGVRGVLKLALVLCFDAIKASVGSAVNRLFKGDALVEGLAAWCAAAAVAVARLAHTLFERVGGGRSFGSSVAELGVRLPCARIGFEPHAGFWRLLLLGGRGSWSVSRRVRAGSRSLCQRDMGTSVAREVWEDVVVSFDSGREKQLSAHFRSPLAVEFELRGSLNNFASDSFNGGNEDSASQPVVPWPSCCDATAVGEGCSDGPAAKSDGISSSSGSSLPTSYLDLVPFAEFRDDVRTHVAELMKKDSHTTSQTDLLCYGINGISGESPVKSTLLSMKRVIDAFFSLDRTVTIRRQPGQTNRVFSEYYLLMCTLALREPGLLTPQMLVCADGESRSVNSILSHVARADIKQTLFGVPVRIPNLADYTYVAPAFVGAFRQAYAVRSWLLMQLCPGMVPSLAPSAGLAVDVHRGEAVDIHGGGGTADRGEASLAVAWADFVHRVCSGRKDGGPLLADGGGRVGVHLARIVEVEKTAVVPNPEFAEYEAELAEMEQQQQQKQQQRPSRVARAPPRTLTERTVEREVLVERVNDTTKPLDTLYLRRADGRALRSSLAMFRDRKELMARLGLPHKLGVLLHGPPGTGKTTTIAAIATFLGKDLYYVSLGTVRTNAELRMLFDRITRNCANGGGIVVLEDVDAMSPVVLRRDGSKLEQGSFLAGQLQQQQQKQQQQKQGDDPLTLEFLLNVLQGTLTADGTVFVATTNHLDALDPAFYREGRFDVRLHLVPCDRHQVACAFRSFFGRDPDPGALAAVKEGTHTPAAVVAHLARFLCSAPADADAVVSCKDADILGAFA